MRRNKYGAIKVKANGYTFDSKAEYARYLELKLLVKAGAIAGLAVHTRWPLYSQVSNAPIDSKDTLVGHYESDFCYVENGQLVVEDVKGVMTALSRWKIKHFEVQHGIKVMIIRN